MEAGVSASTVSRTFNTPHLINQKTKQRVLEVARRMNYKPPRSRSVPMPVDAPEIRTSPVIGFQYFSEWAADTLQGNAFYSHVLAGALAEASDLGIRLMLSTSQRHDPTAPLPPMVVDQTVAGLLLVGVADKQITNRFTNRVSNIVFIDHRDPSGKHDSVLSDNFTGSRMATEHLFKLGHRRIAFLTGEDQADSFSDRLDGFVCAHFAAGIPVDYSLIVRKPHSDSDPTGVVKALLSRPDRPTGIVAANDDHAFTVMRVAHQLQLTIPGDISIIGFDDLQFSAKSIPPLTSMRVQTEVLGRLGVRRLFAKIADSADPSRANLPSVSLIPVQLIERQSCRAIG
jgi:LacI family transcriptional regulator